VTDTLSALHAIARPSVCPSHGWISQKLRNTLRYQCSLYTAKRTFNGLQFRRWQYVCIFIRL